MLTATELGTLATAIGGIIAAVIGGLTLWKRAGIPTEKVRQVLERVRDWLEQATWPIEPGDRLIDHVPASLRRDIHAALDIKADE